ncbi:MAG: type II toxin-antitoxin system YafQ family toxin [Rhodospirillales bacterium]
MRPIRTTRQFERDLKLAKRRGRKLEKLWDVAERLSRNDPLDPRHRPHKLSGEWKAFRECHIEPDWLLIWRDTGEAVIMVRTGTHADLFK